MRCPTSHFHGTITEIAPVSNTDKGSTNYTVRIAVDDLDERLRWGMTAFVNIQVDGGTAIRHGFSGFNGFQRSNAKKKIRGSAVSEIPCRIIRRLREDCDMLDD